MARSKLIELFTRGINIQNRKDKIYLNGSDNLYPERITRIINNSVTAKLCVEKFQSFLIGLGFENEDLHEVIVNAKKGLTFYDILKRISKDVSYQKGAFIHINYDIEGIPNYLDVIPYKNCRISEEDDYDNKGYVWVSKHWDKGNLIMVRNKANNKNWFYPYNPDPKVIMEQRKKDSPKADSIEALIKGYRGQILFFSLEDDAVYPNSFIDPAYNDADTEHRISLFRNDRIKNGFLGANIFLLPEGDDEKQSLIEDDDLKALMGAENSSNILKIEVQTDGDKPLSDYIHVETIKSEVDTEQFQYDEKVIQENIMNCYGIPKILVKNTDSSLFGTNGETLRVAQKIFQEETEVYRKAIGRVFEKIFKKHKEYTEFKIVPLLEDDELTEQKDDTETNTEG